MTQTQTEGVALWGERFLVVAPDRRSYDAIRNLLFNACGGVEVEAITTDQTDCEFAYAVTTEQKYAKTRMAQLRAFAEGVIAGIRYYA